MALGEGDRKFDADAVDDALDRQTPGQVYTPRPVARLLARWAIRAADDEVLDPACGTGRLLVAAADRLSTLDDGPRDPLGQIHGVERVPETAALARASLLARAGERVPSVDVRVGDFFADDPPDADAVLLNPPYTRPGDLSDSYLDAVRATLSDDSWIPRDSGLYAYFLVRVTDLLTEGDRLAVVLPSSVFDATYGRPLMRFLLDKYALDGVVGTRRHRTIRSADVNTVLLFLTRDGRREETTFVATDRRLAWFAGAFDALLAPIRSPRADATTGDASTRSVAEAIHVRRLPQRRLRETTTALTGSGPTRRPAPDSRGLSDLLGHKWNPYLRLSDACTAVLDRHAGAFVRVGDVGEVTYGWKPGAVDFYVLPRPGNRGRHLSTAFDADTGALVVSNHDDAFDGPDEYAIERDCWMRPVSDAIDRLDAARSSPSATRREYAADGTTWVPRTILKSSDALQTRVLEPAAADHVLVSCSEPRATLAETYPGFATHVRWGESREYHRRRSVSGRDPWYAVDDVEPAAIVLTQFHDKRLFHPTNPHRVVLTNTFQQLTVPRERRPFVAGYVNSTLGALATELFGRTNLGAGVLTVYGVDFEAVPIPRFPYGDADRRARFRRALRAFETEPARPIPAAFDATSPGDVTLGSAPVARRRLDRLVFDHAGMDRKEQRVVYRELFRLVSERIRKGT